MPGVFRRGVFLVCCAFLFSDALAAQESVPRIEITPQFTYLNLLAQGNEEQSGFGARVTWNPHPNFALEGELNFLPRPRLFESSTQGGRGLQGLFGIKSGWRKPKWGLHAKARAGFLSFSDVIKRVDFVPVPSITNGRLTEPVLDIGGVVEVYPWKRVSLRYDLGARLYSIAPAASEMPRLRSQD